MTPEIPQPKNHQVFIHIDKPVPGTEGMEKKLTYVRVGERGRIIILNGDLPYEVIKKNLEHNRKHRRRQINDDHDPIP